MSEPSEKPRFESYSRTCRGVFRHDEHGIVGQEQIVEREQRDGVAGREWATDRRVLDDEELYSRRVTNLETGEEGETQAEYQGPASAEEFEKRWRDRATEQQSQEARSMQQGAQPPPAIE